MAARRDRRPIGCAYAPERSAQRGGVGGEMKGEGWSGSGAGGVEGWQKPECIIRPGGGPEQFLWNSIRHQHKRASNPGLASRSISYGSAIHPPLFPFFFTPPTTFNAPMQLAPTPAPAPARPYA